jgi:hypothetical protein
LLHLAACSVVAAVSGLLAFGFWYPMPFREISGGRELFSIVVAVDVVLGPLLTLIVFNAQKPRRELVRDLGTIALLQFIGLLYGLHTLYEARPVVLAVESGHRIRVLRAVDLSRTELDKAPPEWRSLPWRGTLTVATRKLRGNETLEAVKRALEGTDVGMRPELWLPASETAAVVARSGEPAAELVRHYAARSDELRLSIAATGLPVERLRFLPMLARSSDWVALVDNKTGAIVGYAPFDGFF